MNDQDGIHEGVPPHVEVSFPADARFLVMARVTVAALAAELDFDLEAIDDLRIAVDELCVSLLPEDADGRRIHLRTVLDGTSLQVEGVADRLDPDEPPSLIELDELSRSILEVIVDGYQLGPGTFRFWKRGS